MLIQCVPESKSIADKNTVGACLDVYSGVKRFMIYLYNLIMGQNHIFGIVVMSEKEKKRTSVDISKS